VPLCSDLFGANAQPSAWSTLVLEGLGGRPPHGGSSLYSSDCVPKKSLSLSVCVCVCVCVWVWVWVCVCGVLRSKSGES
jgi:hypothetical protein